MNVIHLPRRQQQAIRDKGPMARLLDVVRDPGSVSAIGKRIRKGDTLREIARSYRVPHRDFCDWFGQEVHSLAFGKSWDAARAAKLPEILI